MFKRLITIVAAALIVLVSFNPSSAQVTYEGGLLEDETLIKTNTLDPSTYDNNLGTSTKLQDNDLQYVEFTEPVDIESVYIYTDNNTSYTNADIELEYSDGTKEEYRAKEETNGTQLLQVNKTGIVKVYVRNTRIYDSYLHEIEFFPPQPEPQDIVNGQTAYIGDTQQQALSMSGSSTSLITDDILGSGYTHSAAANYYAYIPFENPVTRNSILSFESDYTYILSGSQFHLIDNTGEIFDTHSLQRRVTVEIPSTSENYITGVLVEAKVSNTSNEFEYLSVFHDETLNTEPEVTLEEVNDLSFQEKQNSITVNYTVPTYYGYDITNIYVDDVLHGTDSTGSYEITGLEPNTTYNIRVSTVNTNQEETQGLQENIMTILDTDGDGIPDAEDPDIDGDGIPNEEDDYPNDPENTPVDTDGDGVEDPNDPLPNDPENKLPEVKNLKIEVKGGKADLSWENPPEYFEKAVIYRRVTGQTVAAKKSWFSPMVVSAAETFEPLFETNGTTFSDLTIQDNTDYEYKVTTMYQGLESAGVITSVKTPIISASLPDTLKANALLVTIMDFIGLLSPFLLLILAVVLVPLIQWTIEAAVMTYRERNMYPKWDYRRATFSNTFRAYVWEEKIYNVRKKIGL